MQHRKSLGLESRTYRYKCEKRNTEYLAMLLQSSSCMECGTDDPRVLQFHHRDPTDKRAKVSSMVANGYALETIRTEIAKCDIICANCHIIRHKELRAIEVAE